jgi:hypothetical protein
VVAGCCGTQIREQFNLLERGEQAKRKSGRKPNVAAGNAAATVPPESIRDDVARFRGACGPIKVQSFLCSIGWRLRSLI